MPSRTIEISVYRQSISNLNIFEKITESTPLNTRKKTPWAVKAFRDWHRFHLTQSITEEAELNVYKP